MDHFKTHNIFLRFDLLENMAPKSNKSKSGGKIKLF